MADLLELTLDLPELELAAGDRLIEEGTSTGSIWVLVSGTLEVRKHGAVISAIDQPGAAFGEVSVLLGQGHTASVWALTPCRVRYAHDGRAFLTSSPELLFLLAAGLAERLEVTTGYLADLRNQYTDAPGIAMVSEVLGRLTQPQHERMQTGSAREPNPEY